MSWRIPGPEETSPYRRALQGLHLTVDDDARSVTLPGGGRLRLVLWEDGADTDVRGRLRGLLDSAERGDAPGDALVLAPWVDATTGKRLHDVGTDYVDAAGNARISRPGVHIHVEGRRRPRGDHGARRGATGQSNRRPGTHSTPAGLRVVFALMVSPGMADATVRDVAAAAMVSVGTAQAVLRAMRDDGHLGAGMSPGRTLLRRGELARLWVIGYQERLVRTLETRHAVPQEGVAGLLERFDGIDGITVAGDAVTPGLLNGSGLVVFGEPPWKEAVLAGRLRSTGDPAPVVLRERFWDEDLLRLGPVAPPLLLAAEVLQSRDPRDREAGERILDEGRHG